jgi:hypothetical protein
LVVEFSDGFETGDTTKWDAAIQTNGIISVEGLNPRFGTKHLRCVSNAGTGQKRVFVQKFITAGNIKHIRAYIYIAPSVVGSAERVTFMALYPSGAPTNYIATVTLLGTKLVSYFRNAGKYAYADSALELSHGAYHCLELGVKVGAGDGELHVWLDGTEVITLLNLSNSEFGSVLEARAGISFTEAVESQTVDMDEVAIGDSYIGPVLPPKPCWIATAAFLSPVAPQLNYLRRFRDQYLPDRVVEAYYRTSPPIADYISKHERIRIAIREVINFGIKLLRALHVVD